MAYLQHLSLEQIAALSPDCLKILLDSYTKENDISKLKSNFNKVMNGTKYGYVMQKGTNYDITRKLQNINELLMKYRADKFYLLRCDTDQCDEAIDMHLFQEKLIQCFSNSNKPRNYRLLTQAEINKLFPIGCDLHKIIHRMLPEEVRVPISSGRGLRIQNGQIVRHVTQTARNIVTDIVRANQNVYFVHPVLLLCASHLFSSQPENERVDICIDRLIFFMCVFSLD